MTTTIQKVVSAEGKTAVTESFEVPNGNNRHFLVEALDASGSVLYKGEKYANLSGTAVTIAIDMVALASDTWISTTSTANVPAARQGAAAVWTGSKMLIWGGSGASGDLNTGGAYDPATDSWTAMSTTNAPSTRRYWSVVWTGTEMIVWGGWNNDNLNTGARYNPSTDTWTPTSTTNAPAARCLMPSVWTGDKMIVWGGYPTLNTGGIYDPSTDTWIGSTSTSNAPVGRQNHTAIWTGTEMIVWGGRQYAGGTYYNNGGRYDPSTDTWTAISTTNAPSARSAGAFWTGNKMLIWGGWIDTGRLDTGAIYDPSTDTWSTISTTNAPKASTGGIWTGTEMIVWGGGNLPDSPNGRYNPSTDTWTTISTANAPSGTKCSLSDLDRSGDDYMGWI